MTAVSIGSALLKTYSSVQQGKAQSKAYEAQSRQSEADARTSTIERKRALLETLAAQNVSAAAQGRTISSLSALQQEDIRRERYDETLIESGAIASAEASRSAGKSAKSQGYLNAGSSLLKGASDYSKLQ